VKSAEKEFFLKRLNGLKELLDENEQCIAPDKEIFISRLNEIKEFLLQEAELELTTTEDETLNHSFELEKEEWRGSK
jgi:hypothetical protein